ncbi:MAG: MFS transporter [Oscillibacter sp.]|nr:MFS transporter [Oscillibacter sp.]
MLLLIIYLSFISLGLPDGLLGSGWPAMYGGFGVPVAWAGILSAIISVGTIISSLMSDRLTRRLGAGRVTALSVATTAAALWGFSLSHSFWMLCLWAVPYGLGAGSVDAALNNYVALHYKSRHMSWLHCMWGLGAAIGPYIMAAVLNSGRPWFVGYRWVGGIQIALTAALVCSLALWRGRTGGEKEGKALSLGEVLRIPGAKEVMCAFFGYCALEQTAMLWGSSYLVLHLGMETERAAGFGCLFFAGITLGRFLNGFFTMRFDDKTMIRVGCGVIAAAILALLLPLGETTVLAGLFLVGFGCAPIYPCIIHSTPEHFGPEQSQAIIGVQMASAYVGTCVAPPVFGFLAQHVGAWIMPCYLLAILLLMVGMHEKLLHKAAH